MSKELAFSVTLKDCEVQFFRAGGPGGQNQNKVSSACRVIHHPSGARGESREHREQGQNKKNAFLKMANHPRFKIWVHQQLAKETPEEWVEKQLTSKNLRVEARVDGTWKLVGED